MMERRDCFGVHDLAATNHSEGLIEINSFVAETRDGDDSTETIPSAGYQARFLAQFTFGTLPPVFARVAASCGNFANIAADRMTPLAQHRDRTVAIQCDDGARARMANYRHVDRHPVGQHGRLHAEVDHAEL